MKTNVFSCLIQANSGRLTSVLIFILAFLFYGGNTFGQTFYNMSSANYSQNFTNIANTTAWPNGYNGTQSQMWRTATSVATSTVNTATAFVTGTAGGVQRGTGALILLATGTNRTATDLLLNFSGRNAGTISLDWAKVVNTANASPRSSDLKIQYSINNGSTFTDLTGYTFPRVLNNTTAQSGSLTSIALPAALNNQAQVVIRFYSWNNGQSGGSGNRPKFSIDNILVTSTPSGNTVTFNANGGTGTMANQTASVSTPLTLNSFTRAGFTFSGWNTASNGSGTAYANGANYPFTASGTLFAQWAPILPTIALSSPAQTGTANINQSSTNNIISHFQAAITTANATLNTIAFTTTGTHVTGDLTGNFKLLYGTTNVFGSATQIATVAVGAPGTRSFTGLTQAINSGVTGYFWIVVDASGTSGGSRTLVVSANPVLTFAAGTPMGTITAGGTKTFIDPTAPSISVGTITAFGNQCINTTSTERNYSVSGSNLLGNIVITPPVGYQISLTSGSGFISNPSTISLTPTGGTVSPTTIYVRFVPTAAILYSANITHTSTSASTQNVAASGTGINGVVAITTTAATSIGTATASSGGTTLSTTCGTIAAKGVVWGLSANPTVPSANSTNEGTGTANFTSSISGLAAGTTYNYRAYATNSNTETNYGTNLTFTTLSLEPTAHAASFTVTSPTSASLTLNFSAASTITNAAGYIIIRRTGAAPTGTPTDAVAYSVGNVIGDGTVAAIISSTSATSTVISGLANLTNYHFRLIPFGYNGSNAASYNYYTNPTIPSSNGSTLGAPVTIWNHPLTGTNPGLVNPYTTGQTFDSDISVSGIGRNGVTGNTGNNRYNTSGWNVASIDLNRYFEFTITPNPGFSVNLNSFIYTSQRSNTSIANFAFRSSIDGYTANIGSPTFSGTTLDLSGTEFQDISAPITFRFYAWGAGAAGNTFSINTFSFTGIISSLGTITTGSVSTSICAGASGVSVPFTYSPAGNFPIGVSEFTAQLSNASGSFAAPTDLQSVTSTGLGSQSISVTIPAAEFTGAGYRIRVVSTAPTIIGSNNGSNITIQNTSTSIAPVAAQNLNPSVNGTTLTVTEGATVTSRQWAYSTISGGPYSNNLGTALTQIPNFATPGTYYIACKSTYGAPCSITVESNEVQINVTVGLPTLSTTAPTAVNVSSAQSGGNITNDGGGSITARGVVWGLSVNPTLPSVNSTADGTGTGSYSSNITGLNPETTYNARAYATNSAGTSYGNNVSFITLSNQPLNQATNLIATPLSSNQIELSWDEADFPASGATVKGYVLIRAISPALPTFTSSNGQIPTAGVGTIVSSTILEPTATFINSALVSSTTYNYLLIPYAWDGVNPETYHYLTLSAPTATATTLVSSCITPTIQASNVLISGISTTGFNINWTLGNGNRSLVILRPIAPVTAIPTDGDAYTPNAIFGLGTEISTNEFVVYGAAANAVAVSGLSPNMNYHVAIFTYNLTGNCYMVSSSATANATTLPTSSVIETFEPGTKTSYTSGNVTCNLGVWNFNDALIGNSAQDKKINTKSARLVNNGSITMQFDKPDGLGTLTVRHAVFSVDGASNWVLEVSTNGGASFDAFVSSTYTASSSVLATTVIPVNLTGNIRIRIRKTSGGGNRMNLDDIEFTSFTAANSIATGVITGSPYCISSSTGQAISVPYTASGLFNSENVFVAQLSNATGNFSTPTDIGSISATSSGVINATIPAGTFAGTGYRIRVISSSPSVSGTDNGSNLSIFLNAPDVLNFFATVNSGTNVTLNWTNPGSCFDEILVIGRLGDFITAIPTGDGTAYTANNVFGTGGSGANLPANEFAVYKTISNNAVVISGLTANTTYFFEVFTRRGTLWSNGVVISVTPFNPQAGDFRSIASGNYSNASTWQQFNGTSWVAATNYPNSSGATPGTATVTIRSGHTVTLDASRTNQPIRNLIVQTNARIWSNDSVYNGNRYLTIYGDITCNGNIGRDLNKYDNISFNIEGNPTTISGSGNFNASRLRKQFSLNQTSEIIVAMDMGLKFASGVGASSGTNIYNNVGGNYTLNLTINENTIVNLFSSIGSSGNISIDGINGEGSGERNGTFRINGTLNVPGTIFAFTNNLVQPITYIIGNQGTVNCVNVCTANNASTDPLVQVGSQVAGCTLSILEGGRLNLTGGNPSDVNTYNKPFSIRTNTTSPFTYAAGLGTGNNIFDFQPGSFVEYSSSTGTMPIQSQVLTYSNLDISGAATKTINSDLNVLRNLTITSPAVLNPAGFTINLGGDWNNYNTLGFIEGLTGTVHFNGSIEQNVYCPDGENFHNVLISNASTAGVVLRTNLAVSGNLDLGTTGQLSFGPSQSVVSLTNMANASNTLLGSASAFIDMSATNHVLNIGCESPGYTGGFDAGATSTVNYNRDAAISGSTGQQDIITEIVYANLNITGSDEKRMDDDVSVNLNFVADGSSTQLRATVLGTELSLGGNFTLTAGATMNIDCRDNLSLSTILEQSQMFQTNGEELRLFDFGVNKTSDVSVEFFANTAVDVKNDFSAKLTGSAGQFIDGGNTIQVGDDVILTGSQLRFNLSGTLRMTGENDGTNTIGDESNQVCQAQLNNVIVQGSGTVSQTQIHPLAGGSTLRIAGNLTIDNSIIGRPGVLRTNNNAMEIGSNWVSYNQSGFIEGSGSVVLNGATLQQITTTGGEIFNELRILNSSGVQLGDDIKMNASLWMLGGDVFAGTNLVELGTSVSSPGTLNYVSGKIQGAMKRWFAASTNTGSSTGLYPVGDAVYERFVTVEYTIAPTTGGSLTTTFMPDDMALFGVPTTVIPIAAVGSCVPFEVSRLSDQGFWEMNDGDGLANGEYSIQFDSDGFTIITDLCELTALKRVGAGNWSESGTHLETTGSTTRPIVQRNGASGWSNWGFGGGSANPLPISLLTFNATPSEDASCVELHWVTSSEINNALFEVERSLDAKDFEFVLDLPGAGYSSTIMQYDSKDFKPYKNTVSYYRLKQIDFNGDFTYSDIVPVRFKEHNPLEIIFANGISNENILQMLVKGNTKGLEARIYDLSGKLISQQTVPPTTGVFHLSLQSISKGMYIVELLGTNGRVQSKFVY